MQQTNKEEKNLRELYERVHAVRGAITEIARRANVCREWVWHVLKGDGVSAKVIAIAEQVIAEREKQTN